MWEVNQPAVPMEEEEGTPGTRDSPSLALPEPLPPGEQLGTKQWALRQGSLWAQQGDTSWGEACGHSHQEVWAPSCQCGPDPHRPLPGGLLGGQGGPEPFGGCNRGPGATGSPHRLTFTSRLSHTDT